MLSLSKPQKVNLSTSTSVTDYSSQEKRREELTDDEEEMQKQVNFVMLQPGPNASFNLTLILASREAGQQIMLSVPLESIISIQMAGDKQQPNAQVTYRLNNQIANLNYELLCDGQDAVMVHQRHLDALRKLVANRIAN